jgi:hypothetical protein
MAVKRWVWVVGGIFTALILICVAIIGAGFFLVSRHLDARPVTAAQAEAEFAAVRARFKDQPPLIEVNHDKVYTNRLLERAGTYKGPLPKTLHVLAWERGEPNRVQLSVPLWLLHMKGKMKVHGQDLGLEHLEISVDDIERAGPGLLIDHTDGRERLLVWTD